MQNLQYIFHDQFLTFFSVSWCCYYPRFHNQRRRQWTRRHGDYQDPLDTNVTTHGVSSKIWCCHDRTISFYKKKWGKERIRMRFIFVHASCKAGSPLGIKNFFCLLSYHVEWSGKLFNLNNRKVAHATFYTQWKSIQVVRGVATGVCVGGWGVTPQNSGKLRENSGKLRGNSVTSGNICGC